MFSMQKFADALEKYPDNPVGLKNGQTEEQFRQFKAIMESGEILSSELELDYLQLERLYPYIETYCEQFEDYNISTKLLKMIGKRRGGRRIL